MKKKNESEDNRSHEDEKAKTKAETTEKPKRTRKKKAEAQESVPEARPNKMKDDEYRIVEDDSSLPMDELDSSVKDKLLMLETMIQFYARSRGEKFGIPTTLKFVDDQESGSLQAAIVQNKKTGKVECHFVMARDLILAPPEKVVFAINDALRKAKEQSDDM